MKYGFEREYFVLDKDNNFVDCSSVLPHDDCGYLAEVRGEPHISAVKSLALFRVEEERVKKAAEKKGWRLETLDYAMLPNKFRLKMLRTHGKNAVPLDQGSMYGKFWGVSNLSRAGLHIHFSNERGGHNNTVVSGFIDIPRYVFALDKFFAKQIKEAKRVPGLYEIKSHGFEYRSLPTSVNMDHVVIALDLIERGRWNEDMQEKFLVLTGQKEKVLVTT